jgi:hypothetical protein
LFQEKNIFFLEEEKAGALWRWLSAIPYIYSHRPVAPPI